MPFVAVSSTTHPLASELSATILSKLQMWLRLDQLAHSTDVAHGKARPFKPCAYMQSILPSTESLCIKVPLSQLISFP